MKSVENRNFVDYFIIFVISLHNSNELAVDISSSQNEFVDTNQLEETEIKFRLHTEPTGSHFSSCRICQPTYIFKVIPKSKLLE